MRSPKLTRSIAAGALMIAVTIGADIKVVGAN